MDGEADDSHPAGWIDKPQSREGSEGRPEVPAASDAEPKWFSSRKQGIGSAPPGAGGRLAFTLAEGVLSEVFYPRRDTACIRHLGLLVVGPDGSLFDETRADHRVTCSDDGIPLFHLENISEAGGFRIDKTTLASPRRDAVLQRIRFTTTRPHAADHRLFLTLDPRLGNTAAGNIAWTDSSEGQPLLLAEGNGMALALACSSPWRSASAGFAGVSDAATELARHGRLLGGSDRAEGRNVSLDAELDLGASGGVFALALGFGLSPDEATAHARDAIRDDFDAACREYVEGWAAWQAGISPPPRPVGSRDLTRIGAMVIATHASDARRGAIVASMSTPWGEARAATNPQQSGGYHMVWPRDLAEAAGGALAVGATREAIEVLQYLRQSQDDDGHWPQNLQIDGKAHWQGVQLGETAIVVLLLDHLRRERVVSDPDAEAYWPMVRRAACYLIGSGPATQQDRWENEPGYTPFTLALMIVALLIAADMADARCEPVAAGFLREFADAWYDSIDRWLWITDTPLARDTGVSGYYARIIPVHPSDDPTPKTGPPDQAVKIIRDRTIPPREVVSADALAFVRFGLLRHDDPRILATLKVIDRVTRVETPLGPCWHRYNGDGYGEMSDGRPFVGKERGKGRLWPLLTGERAHYELAAGRPEEAARLAGVMAAFANEGGMIPEQVWDTDPIPDKGLFPGRPSGSAMPLVWAHAEYLKLCRSLAEGRIFDQPPQARRRYIDARYKSTLIDWRPGDPVTPLPQGRILRVVLDRRDSIRWTVDAGGAWTSSATIDTTLGLHVVDIPSAGLPGGATLRVSVGDKVTIFPIHPTRDAAHPAREE